MFISTALPDFTYKIYVISWRTRSISKASFLKRTELEAPPTFGYGVMKTEVKRQKHMVLM
ncbi:MAG: hypothetical protein CML02_07485 [Pseudooceanicola sp.]|nr:hypothetical protein [Pseudooceanicola sp.]